MGVAAWEALVRASLHGMCAGCGACRAARVWGMQVRARRQGLSLPGRAGTVWGAGAPAHLQHQRGAQPQRLQRVRAAQPQHARCPCVEGQESTVHAHAQRRGQEHIRSGEGKPL